MHYGRIAAVQGLSISVAEGEFVGLVGHNGAGKTTTMNTITGTLKPSRGDIRFNGTSIAGTAPDRILRAGISLVPENRRIFARLSVAENLRIGTSARKDRREAERDIKRMCERFEVLGQFYNHPGAKLSGGQQQQLAIARALLSRPRLLLLDEPTLGLAPLMVDRVFEILQELKDEGVTILLVEQNAARTIEVADRTYVLRSGGRIEFQGTAQELSQIGDFETAYIGLSRAAKGGAA
ncbi:MAG: ATP-binding cassette domain-containing protein [Thermoleophilia bacterium]